MYFAFVSRVASLVGVSLMPIAKDERERSNKKRESTWRRQASMALTCSLATGHVKQRVSTVTDTWLPLHGKLRFGSVRRVIIFKAERYSSGIVQTEKLRRKHMPLVLAFGSGPCASCMTSNRSCARILLRIQVIYYLIRVGEFPARTILLGTGGHLQRVAPPPRAWTQKWDTECISVSVLTRCSGFFLP